MPPVVVSNTVNSQMNAIKGEYEAANNQIRKLEREKAAVEQELDLLAFAGGMRVARFVKIGHMHQLDDFYGNAIFWSSGTAERVRNLTLKSEAPFTADENGQYPVPVPGIWSEI